MSGPGDGRPPWWLGRLTDQQMTILAEYRRPKR
jgi:hypothetical protein